MLKLTIQICLAIVALGGLGGLLWTAHTLEPPGKVVEVILDDERFPD